MHTFFEGCLLNLDSTTINFFFFFFAPLSERSKIEKNENKLNYTPINETSGFHV